MDGAQDARHSVGVNVVAALESMMDHVVGLAACLLPSRFGRLKTELRVLDVRVGVACDELQGWSRVKAGVSITEVGRDHAAVGQ